MNHLNSNTTQLWRMQPHQFNEWRANNDLPKLFAFLKNILPNFDAWLRQHPFEMDVVLRIVPTGEIFKGEKKVVIRRNGDIPRSFVIECREGSPEDAAAWWGKRFQEIEILGEFEPYFMWAKRTLGRKRFFIWDKLNRQVSDNFIRGSCSGLNVDGCVTQAHLFRDFTLLKMGQITLDRSSVIGGKNLDFCDLDFLTITGDMHGYGSTWKTISYSSFRELSFDCAGVSFYTFHHCWIDKVEIIKSKIQDFYFEQTDVRELRILDSFVFRMGFKESNITPFIQNTELREVAFEPKKGLSPTIIATTYRLFRSAFQNNGLRQESSNYYYRERVFERKSYFHPYTIDSKIFSGIRNGGRLSAVFNEYNKGFYKSSDLPREIWKVLISKIKMHALPKYLFPLMKFRFRWLISLIESILWGYGEKPSRILLVALFIISIYAKAYSLVEWMDDTGQPYKQGVWDSIYFSVVTFTTLGYGDITPKTQILKLLAGSEALLGALTIGLIVAGFANRGRY
ncbi:TPA: potassium channel family protein [Citrobacter murliniae]